MWSNRPISTGIMDMAYSHIYGWHVGQSSWSLFWIEVAYQGQAKHSQSFLQVPHTVGGAREEGGKDIGAVLLYLGCQLTIPGATRQLNLGKLQSLCRGSFGEEPEKLMKFAQFEPERRRGTGNQSLVQQHQTGAFSWVWSLRVILKVMLDSLGKFWVLWGCLLYIQSRRPLSEVPIQ